MLKFQRFVKLYEIMWRSRFDTFTFRMLTLSAATLCSNMHRFVDMYSMTTQPLILFF